MLNKVANKIALIIFVLLTVVFTIFSVLGYNTSRENIVDVVKDSKRSLAVSLNTFVDGLIGTRFIAMQGFENYVKNHPEMLYDREIFKRELYKLSSALDVDEIFVGFADGGDMIYAEVAPGKSPNVLYTPLSDKFDARKRSWYIKALEKPDEIVFSDPYRSVSGTMSISIAKALKVDGKIVAVLGIDIYLDSVAQKVSVIKDTPNSYVVVADLKKNVFIAHPNKDYLLSDSKELKDVISLFKNNYTKTGNAGFEYEFKGSSRIGACEIHESSGWLACSLSPISDFDEMLNAVLTNQIITSAIFIVVIVVLLVLFISRFLRPLGSISDGLNSFFKFLNYEIKEPVSIPVSSKDEFGVMATLVNDNIAKIQDGKRLENEFISQANN
ncbi:MULTISPECIES: PDC sensor domain-containing protein, partial [unclassified Campylobacter]|uniref:PDC sensor domain-containing protein n=1 Tax=unclassified Campylobacter TaxID=2593542 RepID=UPI003D33DAD2